MATPETASPTDRLLEPLREALRAPFDPNDTPRVCVAYSGGRDSHALLHLLASHRVEWPELGLRALHVDHGLQAASGVWAQHCERVCTSLDIDCDVHRLVPVSTDVGGPEASARHGRYRAFAAALASDEWLLLAHHADDQAETFLLQALRGAGPDGLSAMPARRRIGPGWLLRPWLGCQRATIEDYAIGEKLAWIDDPTNADTRFDRNFLRREIMPRLLDRWPAGVTTLGRAAERSAAASEVLTTIAREDLSRVRVRHDDTLALAALATLPRERAWQAIRLWLRERGQAMPRRDDLDAIWQELVLAPGTDGGCVATPAHEFRRFAGRLHLVQAPSMRADYTLQWAAPFEPLHIPAIDTALTREAAIRQGLALRDDVVFEVRGRRGGDRIWLERPGDASPRRVSEIMREVGLPPWRRDAHPLLTHDDEVVAIWEFAIAADWRRSAVAGEPGAESESG